MAAVLVTGTAGFIGSKTAQKLLDRGDEVIGIDDVNDYYDIRLKKWRLKQLQDSPGFHFYPLDIADYESLQEIFSKHSFSAVINLAARAGVRYSIQNPWIYYRTNVIGNLNLLELCKVCGIPKYVLASTSSLYAGMEMPFEESRPTTTPISPYAASKGAAEMTCYTYHYLHDIDISVVRYFTVYGPAGRPDMSIFRFIQQIDNEEEIVLYGDGSQSRDFTYVEDITDGNVRALKPLGFEIINLGSDSPRQLSEAIALIERYLGKKARIKRMPFQKTDVKATWANISKARKLLEWIPLVTLEEGLQKTVDWHLSYRQEIKDIIIDMSV